MIGATSSGYTYGDTGANSAPPSDLHPLDFVSRHTLHELWRCRGWLQHGGLERG